MAVKPIPDGYHSVTPYLIVKDGARAIEFYNKSECHPSHSPTKVTRTKVSKRLHRGNNSAPQLTPRQESTTPKTVALRIGRPRSEIGGKITSVFLALWENTSVYSPKDLQSVHVL